jgi:predicted GIY-YIG superfamily endonuclease
MASVYILRGSCGRHYIGSTDNFDRRFAEHCRGKVHSTLRFGQPLEVVVVKQMASIEAAREMERRLKAKKNPQLAICQLNNHPEQFNQ